MFDRDRRMYRLYREAGFNRSTSVILAFPELTFVLFIATIALLVLAVTWNGS